MMSALWLDEQQYKDVAQPEFQFKELVVTGLFLSPTCHPEDFKPRITIRCCSLLTHPHFSRTRAEKLCSGARHQHTCILTTTTECSESPAATIH